MIVNQIKRRLSRQQEHPFIHHRGCGQDVEEPTADGELNEMKSHHNLKLPVVYII